MENFTYSVVPNGDYYKVLDPRGYTVVDGLKTFSDGEAVVNALSVAYRIGMEDKAREIRNAARDIRTALGMA